MTDYVIGFLRKDLSGRSWKQDQARIHSFAAEHGWPVVLIYYGGLDRPGAVINRLMNLAYAEGVRAVIVPSTAYFESGDLAALVKITDVICTDTGIIHTAPGIVQPVGSD
ncbi:hypothetical protein [Nocardia yamanashiensis]|uniref:hypothetical protein n=1 Tax=Nocardia yamanashiensis TaxID=209247 RepID=UPI000AAD23F9|nr:hypothetical protein [Nocardia yamanashiensis]